MNILLFAFALPVAVVIISIALQKILKCPFLVAGIIFSIFLVVTFAINNLSLLIVTIIYTLLSFITALLTSLICRIKNNCMNLQTTSNNCTCENADNAVTISTVYNTCRRNCCRR